MPSRPEAGVVVEDKSLSSESASTPFSKDSERATYHNSHPRTLNKGTEQQHAHDNAPALDPPLHSASNDDDKADEGAQLNDDAEAY
jgi:hypothetical protein